jgi:hypothetical protein
MHPARPLTLSTGKLQSVDGFMNIALESTTEFFNNKQVNSYGDVFIRGNNGEFLPLHLRFLLPLLTRPSISKSFLSLLLDRITLLIYVVFVVVFTCFCTIENVDLDGPKRIGSRTSLLLAFFL